MKVHEDGEIRAAKRLQEYWEKSVNLGSQLNFAYSQLEQISSTDKEHIMKLNQLEEELKEKTLNENELLARINEHEYDHFLISDLLEKVNKFENMLTQVNKDRTDLSQLINKESENVLEIEEQSMRLVEKFEECDNKVSSLSSELSVITRTNLSNRRKATELAMEVAKLMEKISKMSEDLVQSELARKELKRISNDEISHLRSRLIINEENAKLTNLMGDTSDVKLNEINKLQTRLSEVETKLWFFKRNRNSTIQR
jgi:hypothetical protein